MLRRVFSNKIYISTLKIQFLKPSVEPIRRYSRTISTILTDAAHLNNIGDPLSRRQYSEKPKVEEFIVNYDHVRSATLNSNILIVDVREPDEVREHGRIPNSINIPLGNVSTALGNMSEREFEKTYQRPKPTEDSEIIFYCMIGKRSGMAQENAKNLGYKNVKNYLGSWTEWSSKSQ